MISNHSFKLLRLAIFIVSQTRLFPYTWNFETDSPSKLSSRQKKISILISSLNILILLYNSCGLVYGIARSDVQNSEKLLCSVGLGGCLFLILIYVAGYAYENQLIYFAKSCIDVNQGFGMSVAILPFQTILHCIVFLDQKGLMGWTVYLVVLPFLTVNPSLFTEKHKKNMLQPN